MPKTAAFTGFTTTGRETSNSSQFNVSGVFDNGWNFLTGAPGGGTIFFSALSFRNIHGGVLGSFKPSEVEGCFWASGATSSSNARRLNFDCFSVNPAYPGCRSYAFLIFPVVN